MSLLSILNKLLTILLLAGTTLMLLFIVFSGAIKDYPFNRFFWVEADTSAITTEYGDFSRWTFWGICYPDKLDSSESNNCPNLGPDVPISPYDNFGNSTALPQDFVNSRNSYYYLSRFSFPLLLISLVFSGVSFIGSTMAPCWLAMKEVVTFFVSIACIFCMTGAACITAVSVMTRNQFEDNGYSAKVGPELLGMVWASTACLIILFLLTCISTSHKLYKKHQNHQRKIQHLQASQDPIQITLPQTANLPQQPEDYTQAPTHESAGIRFFKIRRDQDKEVEEDSIV